MGGNNSKANESPQKGIASGYATNQSSHSVHYASPVASLQDARREQKQNQTVLALEDPVLGAQFKAALANGGRGIRAIVVGELSVGCLIFQTLPEDRDSRFFICYGYEKIGKQFFIKEVRKYNGYHSEIFKYEVISKEPLYNGAISVSFGEKQTVAVVDVFKNGITVIGDKINRPTLVARNSTDLLVNVGDYLVGEIINLDPYFKATIMAERIFYIKDFGAECQFIEDFAKYCRNPSENVAPKKPEPEFYVRNLRRYDEVINEEFRQHHNRLITSPLQKTPYELYTAQQKVAAKRMKEFLFHKQPQTVTPSAPPLSPQSQKLVDLNLLDFSKPPPVKSPHPTLYPNLPTTSNAPLVSLPQQNKPVNSPICQLPKEIPSVLQTESLANKGKKNQSKEPKKLDQMPARSTKNNPPFASNSSAPQISTKSSGQMSPKDSTVRIYTSEQLIERYGNLSIKDEVPGTDAVIIGKLDSNTRIVQTIPQTGEPEFLLLDVCTVDLASSLSNYYKVLPEIHTFIKIKKQSLVNIINSPFFKKYRVDEYITTEKSDESIGQELVAVVDVVFGGVTVVGKSFVEPTYVPWAGFNKPLQTGDFLIGNIHRLKPFFHSKLLNPFGVVCYYKDIEAEREYLDTMEKHKKNRSTVSAPPEPKKFFYMTGVRSIIPQERDYISTNCREVKDLTLEMAQLYIRDVYIAIARLEKFIRLKSIEESTLEVCGSTNIDVSGSNKRISLTVVLTEKDVGNVIKKKSQDTWRVGTDLSVRHPELERYIIRHGDAYRKEYEAGMTIEWIDYLPNKNCNVRFRPHPRSFDLFDMLVNSKVKLEGMFTIGPSEDFVETIVQTLETSKFDDFFLKRDLFDEWRGVRQKEKVVISNVKDSFDVNGSPLDPSQTVALRTAIGNSGFTCVEAPPGSGKTFLIAAIAAAKYQDSGLEGGSICVSATTNNAISNAIDKVHESYDHIKVVREYSKKMEGEITEKSKEISLREMALKAHKFIDLERHKNVAKAIEGFLNCKSQLKSVANIEQGFNVLDDLQQADYKLRNTFQEAYRPYLIGTTCELMARRGDAVYKRAIKIDNETEKKRLLKYTITHLILDEASQLPPHLALAVYCSLPALKQITLIGDSEQLGPYTPLDEKTFAYKMVGAGELDRIGLGADPTKVYLKTVYRSHPRIVDLLLAPIYGNDLKAGLTAAHRNLSQVKGLPCADDQHKTPVLFVNIEEAKNDDRGVNAKELNVVLEFIETLRKKGVTGEDVAVVCNHHVQREAITNSLKGKGTFGVLNTSVGVYTVDSFQGKEAKVVLILTTKTATDPKMAKFTFQFVANPNRGCVAVSRGQHAVYLFGQWFNLVRTEFWSKFVDGIVKSRAMVKSDWSKCSPEDYHKLKNIVAESAPQKPAVKNAHFGGRGTHNKAKLPYQPLSGVKKSHQPAQTNQNGPSNRSKKRQRRGGRSPSEPPKSTL